MPSTILYDHPQQRMKKAFIDRPATRRPEMNLRYYFPWNFGRHARGGTGVAVITGGYHGESFDPARMKYSSTRPPDRMCRQARKRPSRCGQTGEHSRVPLGLGFTPFLPCNALPVARACSSHQPAAVGAIL